jgi:hypothetical protein
MTFLLLAFANSERGVRWVAYSVLHLGEITSRGVGGGAIPCNGADVIPVWYRILGGQGSRVHWTAIMVFTVITGHFVSLCISDSLRMLYQLLTSNARYGKNYVCMAIQKWHTKCFQARWHPWGARFEIAFFFRLYTTCDSARASETILMRFLRESYEKWATVCRYIPILGKIAQKYQAY